MPAAAESADEALVMSLAQTLKNELVSLQSQPNAALYRAIAAVTTAPAGLLELDPCLHCAAAAAAKKGTSYNTIILKRTSALMML
jgi:cellulase/cellobiase CelA1